MLSTQSSYIEKYTHLAQISSQKYNIPIEIIWHRLFWKVTTDAPI